MDKEDAVTILVTGATGLLGSHVVDQLVTSGRSVRAMVLPGENTERLDSQGVEVVRGDMGDHASLKSAVRDIERVLHCAAKTGPWGPLPEYQRANVDGLRALVDAALAAGVSRFVHVSSITVLGNDVGGSADESAPLRVEPNPYSRTKVTGERLIGDYIRGQQAPITIVRPGWIYGPRDAASFGRFATMIRDGKMVVIGTGQNHVPLIYVTDVANGVILASEAPAAVGNTYLLVNDERVTQNDYLTAIARELGVQAPTRHIPYRLAVTLGATAEVVARATHMSKPPIMRYGLQLSGGENRFDISRARRDLGFVPKVMLAEGVRESVNWYRAAEPLTVA